MLFVSTERVPDTKIGYYRIKIFVYTLAYSEHKNYSTGDYDIVYVRCKYPEGKIPPELPEGLDFDGAETTSYVAPYVRQYAQWIGAKVSSVYIEGCVYAEPLSYLERLAILNYQPEGTEPC